MSGQMEAFILKTSGSKTAEDFFEGMGRKAKPPMIKMYNEIKNANTIVKELAINQNITLDELLRSKKLVYTPPIKGYSITDFNKLRKDVSSLAKTTKDEKYKKLWYQLVRSIDGHHSLKRRTIPTTTSVKTDPGWNSVDKRN